MAEDVIGKHFYFFLESHSDFMTDQSLKPDDRILEEIRDIVTCAICLELFDNACILTCSHTYCLMCLYALCEETVTHEYTKCPQCRTFSIPPTSKLSQLPQHVFCNRLADLVRNKEGMLVEEGESKSKAFEHLLVCVFILI